MLALISNVGPSDSGDVVNKHFESACTSTLHRHFDRCGGAQVGASIHSADLSCLPTGKV